MSRNPNPSIGDRSYGIIALRFLPSLPPTATSNIKPTPKTTQLLLIKQKTCLPVTNPPFWTFPKGHAEPSDVSLQHTAIRELREETGLQVDIGDILELHEEFREVYTNPIRKVGKEVRYWVALVKGGQGLRVDENEVEEARWCRWDEAPGLITFNEGKEVLRRVGRALEESAML